MDDSTKDKSQLNLVKELLAQHLGVEPEDINYEDSLSEDLHMRATDFTDFLEILSSKGLDTTKLDLPDIQTFEDLIRGLDVEDQL